MEDVGRFPKHRVTPEVIGQRQVNLFVFLIVDLALKFTSSHKKCVLFLFHRFCSGGSCESFAAMRVVLVMHR